uniref:NADH-ubiquinone oxidoreductase chain 5 n=1 Tax=Neanthes glandicincta TaxID=595970 RepID=A0A343J7G3_9ANNE|nr:NADH dehydrogenase subunit 5 [Neanthes glandicincta]ASW20413.1 NADH dehydrogenase subunit 5 [Neanthes glandicincta]
MTMVLSIFAFLFLVTAMSSMFINSTIIVEWQIMDIYSAKLSMPLIIDPAGTLFMCTVLTIAASVMQFTKSYMAHEKFLDRFVLLVMLFVMSMLILILFPNMITLLLGWDGLGITSFVLVIYYQNPKSLGAGMITALTNRIGDVMILLSIALSFNQGHWLIINMHSSNFDTAIIFMIMVAAMTKSAQMPFSSWLPAAMAAPTPVSALVHSSTLVTAGVFLLFRFHPFLKSLQMFNYTLTLVASLTMLMAGMSAMAECDMKKIIALSTLSQLGVMMFTIGVNMPNIAFFHLITHALFKALLFICAGNLIHLHHHSQDLRTMGNVSHQVPFISAAMTIANMALCGMPFLAGFYSKDMIIESYLASQTNFLIILMFMTATILTTAYSTRFTAYVLIGPTFSPAPQYTEEHLSQIKSLMILTLGALMGGSAINWALMAPLKEPILPLHLKTMPLLMLMAGVAIGTMMCVSSSKAFSLFTSMNALMWFLTPISCHSSIPISMYNPYFQLKITDQGWNESPQLLFNFVKSKSMGLTLPQFNPTTNQIMSATLILLSASYML